MVNAATITAAIISFISLALIAIALATNSWVAFDTTKEGLTAYKEDYDRLNGVISNTELTGTELQYSAIYFGLWVVCYHEILISNGEISCGFISHGCNATICWTRNFETQTCQNDAVKCLDGRCMAFRITRAFTILGTLFLIFGAALLLVSTCMTSRNLLWFATVFNSLAVIFSVLAFVVFLRGVYRPDSLPNVAEMGWSFIMVIVSWPLGVIATIFSVLGALSTPAKEYEYDESE